MIGENGEGTRVTAATVVFLVIGGVGLALLAFALLGGEIAHIGGIGADGLVSLEAVAGFLGALGFGGAITAEVLDARTPGLIAVSTAVAERIERGTRTNRPICRTKLAAG